MSNRLIYDEQTGLYKWVTRNGEDLVACNATDFRYETPICGTPRIPEFVPPSCIDPGPCVVDCGSTGVDSTSGSYWEHEGSGFPSSSSVSSSVSSSASVSVSVSGSLSGSVSFSSSPSGSGSASSTDISGFTSIPPFIPSSNPDGSTSGSPSTSVSSSLSGSSLPVCPPVLCVEVGGKQYTAYFNGQENNPGWEGTDECGGGGGDITITYATQVANGEVSCGWTMDVLGIVLISELGPCPADCYEVLNKVWTVSDNRGTPVIEGSEVPLTVSEGHCCPSASGSSSVSGSASSGSGGFIPDPTPQPEPSEGDCGGLAWTLTHDSPTGGWVEHSANDIEFRVSQSANCGGSAIDPQYGEASGSFTVPSGKQLRVTWQLRAIVEREDAGFDQATLDIGSDSILIDSSGDSLGCVGIEKVVDGETVLPSGTNPVVVTYDTVDSEYHNEDFGLRFIISDCVLEDVSSSSSSASSSSSGDVGPTEPADGSVPGGGYSFPEGGSGSMCASFQISGGEWSTVSLAPNVFVPHWFVGGGFTYDAIERTFTHNVQGQWALPWFIYECGSGIETAMQDAIDAGLELAPGDVNMNGVISIYDWDVNHDGVIDNDDDTNSDGIIDTTDHF